MLMIRFMTNRHLIALPLRNVSDFDMSKINQAYIRFRHYSDVGFPQWQVSGQLSISVFGVARKPC